MCHVSWCLLESRWILSCGWKVGQIGKIHKKNSFLETTYYTMEFSKEPAWFWPGHGKPWLYHTAPDRTQFLQVKNTSKTLFNGMSIFIQSITNIIIDSDRYLQGLTWIAGWVSGSARPNSTLVGCIGQTAIAVLKVASLFANISAVPLLLSILVRQSSWKKTDAKWSGCVAGDFHLWLGANSQHNN